MNPIDNRTVELAESESAELSPSHREVEAPAQSWVTTVWLLWGNRQVLKKFLLTGLLFSILLALLLPNKYKATTELMPPEDKSENLLKLALGSSVAGILPAGASGALGIKSEGDLFVGVLQSRSVADAIINRFDLRKVYRDRFYEQARRDLGNNAQITLDRKSGIITISILDRSPDRASAIANEYVNQLDHLVSQLSSSGAHRERIFLEERLKVAKQELDVADQELSQFSSKSSVLDITEQGKAEVEAGAALQGQLIAAESDQRALEQIYTADSAQVKQGSARIGELRRQLQKLGGQNQATKDVGPNETSLYPSLRQLPLLGVKYIDLYRRAKIDEAIFETLTKEYELARIEEAKEIPTVGVLDVAKPPERKDSPHRPIIVLLGSIVSLLVGALFVIGCNAWEQMDPDDDRKLLGGELAALVGRLFSRASDMPLRFGQALRRKKDGSDLP